MTPRQSLHVARPCVTACESPDHTPSHVTLKVIRSSCYCYRDDVTLLRPLAICVYISISILYTIYLHLKRLCHGLPGDTKSHLPYTRSYLRPVLRGHAVRRPLLGFPWTSPQILAPNARRCCPIAAVIPPSSPPSRLQVIFRDGFASHLYQTVITNCGFAEIIG
jgi:hypothetical protein